MTLLEQLKLDIQDQFAEDDPEQLMKCVVSSKNWEDLVFFLESFNLWDEQMGATLEVVSICSEI